MNTERVDGHPSGERRRSGWSSTRLSVTLFAAATLLSVPIFVRMSAPGINSDIILHAEIARRSFADGRWFSYTVYSPLLIGISGNGHLMPLRVASIGILAVAVGAKVVLARSAASEWGASARTSAVLAISTFFVTPVLALRHAVSNAPQYSLEPFGAIYLGRLSATVWHNSTMIASIPFVIVAAMFSQRASADPRRSICLGASLVIAVACLFKPNYPLALLPVLIPAVMYRSRRTGEHSLRESAGLGLLLGIPTGVVLVAQYILTQSDDNIVQSRFAIDPMTVWTYYASSIPVALGLSIVFPVLATVAVVRARRAIPPWLLVSWLVFGVGVVHLALFSQRDRITNELIWSGDWFWGPHTAVLILFLSAGAELSAVARGSDHAHRDLRWIPVLAWLALALHTLSGAVYIWRLFALQSGFAT